MFAGKVWILISVYCALDGNSGLYETPHRFTTQEECHRFYDSHPHELPESVPRMRDGKEQEPVYTCVTPKLLAAMKKNLHKLRET